MRVPSSLFELNADQLAKALIGKVLCRQLDGQIIRLRITETECYMGEEDSACHAHCGKTKRNSPLWLSGGFSYVYLCYGIHHLLNIVSGPEGYPQAVLIRGVDGYDGPGKLTRALSVDRSLNCIDLRTSNVLWLEEDGTVLSFHATPRIGIDYAAPEDKDRLWRFIAD